jgi:hypothetical protein
MLDRSRLMRLITRCALLAVSAIAVSAIAAACFGTRDLQQLALAGEPTRPLVALGLLACALGAVLAPRGPALARLSIALGSLALALGAASLAQTVPRVPLPDLGSARDAVAGLRMPPNSAIALGLAASAVLCLRRLPSAGALLAGLSAAIGATALLGYATGIEPAYGWARLESMTSGTAACFVLLGAALWGLASGERARSSDHRSRCGGDRWSRASTLSVSLLLGHYAGGEDFLRTVALGARRAEAELCLAGAKCAARDPSREWESRWIQPRSGWDSDVWLLMARAPELRDQWIDARGRVAARRCAPPASARQPGGAPPACSSRRACSVSAACIRARADARLRQAPTAVSASSTFVTVPERCSPISIRVLSCPCPAGP